MKYIQLYPNASRAEELGKSLMHFINIFGPCDNCGHETHFADMDIERFVCSEECRKASIEKFDQKVFNPEQPTLT